MKKYFVGVLLLLMSVSLYAQNASVRGFVYDKTTGEPVIFANVVIENTTIGAATDVNGYFVISKLKEGSYNLKIGTIGYETATYPIKLEKGKVSSVKIDLQPSVTQLSIVEINGRKESARLESQVSVEKITSKHIQQMPSIGGQAD
jgi:hypothetical protein